MKHLSAVLVSAILMASCKTYSIPVDSFREQLSGAANHKEVTTQGPMGQRKSYQTLALDSIHALDKNGREVAMAISPAVEIRVTDNAGKKTVFYLDLVEFDGVNITGNRSRIISSIRKSIPISTITRIEVQNGGKNYRYVN